MTGYAVIPLTTQRGDTGQAHIVELSAKTGGRDISPGQEGIYFGRIETFKHSGLQISVGSLRLVDHADQSSWHDYLPTLQFGHDKGQLDIAAIEHYRDRFTDARLARMAMNASVLMKSLAE
ncbi:hypothetical protein KBD11_02305 [Candidatus Saccharibacteria bacterium]|nr:hypothetical protein [Candidatus Saccharibacteria bacterium]